MSLFPFREVLGPFHGWGEEIAWCHLFGFETVWAYCVDLTDVIGFEFLPVDIRSYLEIQSHKILSAVARIQPDIGQFQSGVYGILG